MPGAALARCALFAGAGQVVVDQRGGHRHGQFGRHLGEHVGLVFQRGHAHFQAAQWLRDVLQRQPVGLGRCQAQRWREQLCGHMADEAAVGVQHGALGQRGRDLAGGQVRQVGDVSVQRRLLQRIGAQPVGHIAQRHTGPHRLQGLFWREQAAPHGRRGLRQGLAAALVPRVPGGVARVQLAGQQQGVTGHAVGRDLHRHVHTPAQQGLQPRRGLQGSRHLGQCGGVGLQGGIDHGVVQPRGGHLAQGLRLVQHSGQPRCAGGGRLGAFCLLGGVQQGGSGVRQHRIARVLCGQQGVHAGGGHQPQRPPGAVFVGTGLRVEADPQRIRFRQIHPLAARGAGGQGRLQRPPPCGQGRAQALRGRCVFGVGVGHAPLRLQVLHQRLPGVGQCFVQACFHEGVGLALRRAQVGVHHASLGQGLRCVWLLRLGPCVQAAFGFVCQGRGCGDDVVQAFQVFQPVCRVGLEKRAWRAVAGSDRAAPQNLILRVAKNDLSAVITGTPHHLPFPVDPHHLPIAGQKGHQRGVGLGGGNGAIALRQRLPQALRCGHQPAVGVQQAPGVGIG